MQKQNYTAIPNEFIDKYMSQLSPAASLVYITICRHTIGWHKDTDTISLNRLCEFTGLTRKTILKAITELEDCELIKAERKRNRTTVYELVFEAGKPDENSAEVWEKIPPQKKSGCKNSTTTGVKNPPQVVENFHPQKRKEIKKEKLRAESTCSTGCGSFQQPEKNKQVTDAVKPPEFSPPLPNTQLPTCLPKGTACQSEERQTTAASLPKQRALATKIQTPFQAIDAIFRTGSEALTGKPYYKDGKEAKHIKLLEARYQADPQGFLSLCRKYYAMIQTAEDDFNSKQPFTPSAFNSLYNRIAAYQPGHKLKSQYVNQHKDEWQLLMEEYGGYEQPQLEYLQRAGTLSSEEVAYIIAQKSQQKALTKV